MEENKHSIEEWIVCVSFCCFCCQVNFLWGNWEFYDHIFYSKLGVLFLYSLPPYLLILFAKLMYNCYIDIMKCHGKHNFDDFIDKTIFCLKAFSLSIMCAIRFYKFKFLL